MKRIITTTLVLLLTHLAYSQQFGAQAYVQNTIMGIQQGYGVFYDLNKVGLGLIHQSSNDKISEKSSSNYSLSGVELRYAVTQCGKLGLTINPVIGLVNNQFVAVIPQVQTQYKVSRFFSINLGTGIRARQAATSLGISIHI